MASSKKENDDAKIQQTINKQSLDKVKSDEKKNDELKAMMENKCHLATLYANRPRRYANRPRLYANRPRALTW